MYVRNHGSTMQSVNTFFVMSGLLVGLIHMRELRQLANGRQWGVFALNYTLGRVVRILPNLVVVRGRHSGILRI